MPSPLLALGPHVFEVLPVTLQKIEREVNLNWPGISRFGGPVARQATGEGEHSVKLNGLLFPAAFGGWASYNGIIATALEQEPLMMMGFGVDMLAEVLGLVVITKVHDTQDYLGPDGVGQQVTFDVEVAPFGDEGPYGGGLFG